ncbi:MAG: hypothetical protein HY912_04440 [Desulfomonile tiedjei]|uniref:Uncharacterized protein n=1 Tax=Desulfomonile tiedjei TaxID=2358 RepID=A0A9D6V3Y8_9BACT|nr:hypothetical protein [Desulfomonile tiedjei]
MGIVKIVIPFVVLGVVALLAMPSAGEAACACSGIGVSNGYYANPAYGGYGPGYGYATRTQVQSVKPKPKKSKKGAPKQQPAAK